MNLTLSIMIGFGVAMDASAVAMANGMAERRARPRKALYIALVFGLFQGIMPVFGYYFGRAFSALIPVSYTHLSKLNFLINKFRELDKIGYRLADAVAYLETLEEAGPAAELERPAVISEEAVNMMTIHKSKGLEFPVCYYADTETAFKQTDVKARALFSCDYGIVLPVFDEGDVYKRQEQC